MASPSMPPTSQKKAHPFLKTELNTRVKILTRMVTYHLLIHFRFNVAYKLKDILNKL